MAFNGGWTNPWRIRLPEVRTTSQQQLHLSSNAPKQGAPEYLFWGNNRKITQLPFLWPIVGNMANMTSDVRLGNRMLDWIGLWPDTSRALLRCSYDTSYLSLFWRVSQPMKETGGRSRWGGMARIYPSSFQLTQGCKYFLKRFGSNPFFLTYIALTFYFLF